MADLPVEVEEVKVMRLQPGDVIVAKVSDRVLTGETITSIKAGLEGVFPGHTVIVVSGLDLEVARPSDNDGQGAGDG